MACVDKVLNDVIECAADESKFAGFSRQLAIARPSEILTWPTFNAAASGDEDEADEAVKTSSAFAFKTGFCFKKIPAILEQVGMVVKKDGNSFTTELTLRMQNNSHNRGWLQNEAGTQLVILAKEPDETYYNLLGRPDFPARIKKDGGTIEFGKEFNSDEYIEVVFEYKPFVPAIYTGAVSYTPAS